MKKTTFILLLLIFPALINLYSQETFRVMSYNIRYDCFSTNSINCKQNEDSLSYRKIAINDIINTSQPDIIGIQEIKADEIESVI